jgi:hypothetical protein
MKAETFVFYRLLKKAHLRRCARIASLGFVFVARGRARSDFTITDTITINARLASGPF